jgi:Aspartyl/Asparaginyl beta-hydroxylase
MAILERILAGRGADRIRFMKLAPGGELARHADITNRDAGLADGRLARLHLPIQISDAVIMHGWDKRGGHFETRFPVGALCYLDQRGPHRVENRNPAAERIHLVVDMHAGAALRDQIAAAMNGPAALA